MKADPGLVKSYATALFEAARNKGALDEVAQQAMQLKQLVLNEPKLVTFMDTPNIPRDAKDKLFRKVFGGRFNSMLIHFVSMLIVRGRTEVFEPAIFEFNELYLASKGFARAELATAVPLSDEDKSRLERELNAFTGKQLQISHKVDPTLIGGIRFKCGDLLIDNTLRASLSRLSHKLNAVKVY